MIGNKIETGNGECVKETTIRPKKRKSSLNTGFSSCIEDQLVASGWFFCRVVVSLTHSPFPYSTLFENLFTLLVENFNKYTDTTLVSKSCNRKEQYDIKRKMWYECQCDNSSQETRMICYYPPSRVFI